MGEALAGAASVQVTTPSAAGSQAATVDHRPRVWEQWPGNDVFCCDGRVMVGPTWTGFLITALLIMCPSVLLWVRVLPDLVDEYAPPQHNHSVCFSLCPLFPANHTVPLHDLQRRHCWRRQRWQRLGWGSPCDMHRWW